MKTSKYIAVAMLCFSTVGCYNLQDKSNKAASNVGLNGGVDQNLSLSLIVKDQNDVVLFDSSKANSAGFKSDAGKLLKFNAKVNNHKVGVSALVIINNSSVPGNTELVRFNIDPNSGSGSGQATPPTQGDYVIAAAINNKGVITNDSFVASVQCANPSFTVGSLNGSAIAVNGNNGISSYNASGVVSGANGQAPYRCAFDFNGDGVLDSQLAPCGTAVSNKLSTYVLSRKISVVVADACNTSYVVDKTIALPAATPAMPGNIFIASQNSAATGCATDIRANNLTYRAENAGGFAPCDPKYGNGAFTIQCLQKYGLDSSKDFGTKIDVTGLGNYDIRTNSGVIDFANAKVSGITQLTDEAGDASPAMQFKGLGANCVSNVQARVFDVVMKPCASGNNATENSATVEVWGSFTCSNVSNACGSMTVSGKFDGYYHLNDNCVGGGQGGGGDPDPNF